MATVRKKSSHPGARWTSRRTYNRSRVHIHEMVMKTIVRASSGERLLSSGTDS